VHQLSGGLAGAWSIAVSANWQIMFEVADDTIGPLDLEDYH
jgi:plasmid maintenance system killer protein